MCCTERWGIVCRAVVQESFLNLFLQAVAFWKSCRRSPLSASHPGVPPNMEEARSPDVQGSTILLLQNRGTLQVTSTFLEGTPSSVKFGSVSAWRSLEIETFLFFWMGRFKCAIPTHLLGETRIEWQSSAERFRRKWLLVFIVSVSHQSFCLFNCLCFPPSFHLFLYQYFSSSLAFLVCGYSKKSIGFPITK